MDKHPAFKRLKLSSYNTDEDIKALDIITKTSHIKITDIARSKRRVTESIQTTDNLILTISKTIIEDIEDIEDTEDTERFVCIGNI